MSIYVIYDNRSSVIVENRRTRTRSYKSLKSAKSARTKMLKSGQLVDNDQYDDGIAPSFFEISEYTQYQKNIEQFEIVKNILSGKEVRQSVNTPACCDVSTELYHTM